MAQTSNNLTHKVREGYDPKVFAPLLIVVAFCFGMMLMHPFKAKNLASTAPASDQSGSSASKLSAPSTAKVSGLNVINGDESQTTTVNNTISPDITTSTPQPATSDSADPNAIDAPALPITSNISTGSPSTASGKSTTILSGNSTKNLTNLINSVNAPVNNVVKGL